MKLLFLVFSFLPIVCFAGNSEFETTNTADIMAEPSHWFSILSDEVINSNAEIQYTMGTFYYHGYKEFSQNYEKAFEWFHKAANQGHAKAQDAIGIMHYEGQGVSQNYEKAFEWFYRAAYQNLPEAQVMVGVMYRDGKGAPKNNIRAYVWLKLAENNGYNVFALTGPLVFRYLSLEEIAQANELLAQKHEEILEQYH